MERSLKSISSLSLNEINFSGFRLSKSWVGFFEKKDSFSYPLIDEAISLFEDFFGKEDEGVIVIAALSFNDERVKLYDNNHLTVVDVAMHREMCVESSLDEI